MRRYSDSWCDTCRGRVLHDSAAALSRAMHHLRQRRQARVTSMRKLVRRSLLAIALWVPMFFLARENWWWAHTGCMVYRRHGVGPVLELLCSCLRVLVNIANENADASSQFAHNDGANIVCKLLFRHSDYSTLSKRDSALSKLKVRPRRARGGCCPHGCIPLTLCSRACAITPPPPSLCAV